MMMALSRYLPGRHSPAAEPGRLSTIKFHHG